MAATPSKPALRRAAALTWPEYVASVVGADRNIDVADKTGIDTATISRWMKPRPGRPTGVSCQTVLQFARGYRRPFMEALLVAGYVTEEEAGMKAPTGDGVLNLSMMTNAQLARVQRDVAAEVQKRLAG